jgi:hypothetical protein
MYLIYLMIFKFVMLLMILGSYRMVTLNRKRILDKKLLH